MKGARLLIVLLIAFVAFIWATTSCAPSRGTLRQRFDAWALANVHVVHESIGTVSGWYDPYSRTAHFDDALLDDWARTGVDQPEFWRVHELGHAAAIDMGLWIGSRTPCGPFNCPSAERAAQCVAEAVTGIEPAGTDDARGYINCSDEQVRQTIEALNAFLERSTS